MTRTGGTDGTFRLGESLNAEDLAGNLTNIERRLTSVEETVQGVDSRLSRIEGIV
jgi:hypothetical protein